MDKTIGVKLKKWVHIRIKKEAVKISQTMSELVGNILEDFIANRIYRPEINKPITPEKIESYIDSLITDIKTRGGLTPAAYRDAREELIRFHKSQRGNGRSARSLEYIEYIYFKKCLERS